MSISHVSPIARVPSKFNGTTDYVPTPEAYFTSPDTRVPVQTVEPVDVSSAAVTVAPAQGYDVEAHQRLANYTATALSDSAQQVESQNAFIGNLYNSLIGQVG